MNGYSKIKVFGTRKSRSIDFSDLCSPPDSPKPITVPTSKAQETKQTSDIKTKNLNTLEPFPEQEHEEDGVGERFGVILNRSYSVSATSRRFNAAGKNNNSLVQSSVKRAFSMRRSSSIADGYSRIHDQNSPLFSSTDDDCLTTMKTRSKKTRGKKILKACKSLFGF